MIKGIANSVSLDSGQTYPKVHIKGTLYTSQTLKFHRLLKFLALCVVTVILRPLRQACTACLGSSQVLPHLCCFYLPTCALLDRCCVETQLRLSVVADQGLHLLHGILAQLTRLSSTVHTLRQLHESGQRAQLAQQISRRADLLMGLVLLYASAKAHRQNLTRQCQNRGSCWLQGLYLGADLCQWMGVSAGPLPRQWLCELRRLSQFLLGWTGTGVWVAYTAYQLLHEEQKAGGLLSSSRSSSTGSTTACAPTGTEEATLLHPSFQPLSRTSTLDTLQPSTGCRVSCSISDSIFHRVPACLASLLEVAAQLLSTALLAHLSVYVPMYCAAVALMGGSWYAWLSLHCVRFACMHVFASAHPGTGPLQLLSIFNCFKRSRPDSNVLNPRLGVSNISAALYFKQQLEREQQMYGDRPEKFSAPCIASAEVQPVSVQAVAPLLLLQLVLPLAHGILPFALEMLFGYGVRACLSVGVLFISHVFWQQVHKLLGLPLSGTLRTCTWPG